MNGRLESPAPRLAADEVHLWHARVEEIADPALLARYFQLLCEEEARRQQRFVFERDRHLYLVSHALVRTCLSLYVDVDPCAWRFVCNRYGRPEVAWPATTPALRFNLSHTRGMAVVAVALERDIGVDVEDVSRREASVGIAEHYFSPSEVHDLRAMHAAAQHAAFFDYWTLKEAYIKARGMGLSLPLKQFSFHFSSARDRVRISFDPELGDDPESWQFEQFQVAARHKIAVAARQGPGQELRFIARPNVPLLDPPASKI